jgi:hypothetical protein
MTAVPGRPSKIEQIEPINLPIAWPDDATTNALPATHFLLINDGGIPTDGVFLLVGQAMPPAWLTEDQRKEGMEKLQREGAAPALPMQVQGAFYLTRAKAREVHDLLSAHLERTDQSDVS